MNIPTTIGRYEILDELGRGAMGSVFRARDPAMDRIVAVKTILSVALASEQGAEYRQRFYREARAAGALAHPGIVPVFDVGEFEGTPFLVMEFVNGQTLADAMKKGERSSLDRVCEIGQRIAEALGYAHRNGVIHRDIKPANILLTSREAYGDERPKITDFGVAKLTAGEVTTSGQLLGTPAFMPPEQFTGAAIDGRTDLFSLGVILYWMATGEQPFPGETMTAVSYKIVHTEPVPPGKLNPAVPSQLEKVILKCLAKSPADRYQTGEELAQALAELRVNAKGAVLQTAMPATTMASGESQDTLDATPSLSPKSGQASVAASAVPPLQQAPPAPLAKDSAANAIATKKGGVLALAAVALAVVAGVAGGGYFLLHRPQPAPQQPAPVAVAAPAPVTPAPGTTVPPAPAAAAPAEPAKSAKPSAHAATQAGTPKLPQKAAASPSVPIPAPPAPVPVTAPAPLPQLEAVAFDPKKLDPKQNTRLKVDLDHFPPGLAFTVAMNGKTFIKSSAGNKADYENLYVPPGVHEFSVTVSAGGVEKVSNIVSAEFVAKKHMTLKVEIRPQVSSSSPASPALNPAAQVIATLKVDRFAFLTD